MHCCSRGTPRIPPEAPLRRLPVALRNNHSVCIKDHASMTRSNLEMRGEEMEMGERFHLLPSSKKTVSITRQKHVLYIIISSEYKSGCAAPFTKIGHTRLKATGVKGNAAFEKAISLVIFKRRNNPTSTHLNPPRDPNTVVLVIWWSRIPFQNQTYRNNQ